MSEMFSLQVISVMSMWTRVQPDYAANMWKEALEVRKMMRDCKVRRKPGCSWIEVNGIVQEFHDDDDTLLLHFSSDQIFLLLEELKETQRQKSFEKFWPLEMTDDQVCRSIIYYD